MRLALIGQPPINSSGQDAVLGTQTEQLQVKTDLNSLTEVLAWSDRLENAEIPRQTWIACQTALAEAFSNAVRHAHQGMSADTPIQIEVTIQHRSLALKVWDEGPGFDFNRTLEKATETVDEHASGGRGLPIMQRIGDEVTYTRDADGRNCLHLIKYY